MPGVKTFGVPIDLVQNELRNPVLQNLGSAPGTPVNGQFYYLTTGGHDVQTRVNGSWVSLLPSSLLALANTWTNSNIFNGAITGNNTINLTGTGSSSVAGTLTATAHISTGLTGAVAASRYVGATAAGAPASGTFALGDFVIDQTGTIYVCTVAGTSGTWKRVGDYLLGTANGWTAAQTFTGGVLVNTVGITGNKEINLTGTAASSVAGTLSATAHISTGLTGAQAASRYVGATASAAPASGTFAVGDFVIAQNGKIWICTGAGTPGTWADVAAGGLALGGTVASETTYGQASNAGAGTTASKVDHTHGTPTHVGSDHSAISISSLSVPTADVAWNAKKITGLLDPTTAQDAATKAYVDAARAGLSLKDPVRVATTTNGAIATAFANTQTVDGVALITGDRILIKNQTTASENGIYIVNATGAPTRASDADGSGEIVDGTAVWVQSGTLNGDQRWTVTATGANPWNPGTTTSTWTMDFAATSTTAGAGLTATGNVIAVGAANGITVNADSIQVDTAVVTRKYSAAFGNGTLTTFTINHNLNTQDVTVAVYQNSSTWNEIECDIQHTDANNVTLLFSVAPTTNQYRVVVHG